MREQEAHTAPRPPLPALPPTVPGHRQDAEPDAPAWAQWLNESNPPGDESNTEVRASTVGRRDLLSDDPMAEMMLAARERAAQTKRRRQIRDRMMLAAAAFALVIALAVGIWVKVTPNSDDAQQTTTAETPAVVANPPSPAAWCQTFSTADRVSGSSTGDLNTGPGIILHLEYAWYVLRDAAVVRSLLTPDAQAAPEQATRDAISAIPAGTQHCVSIAPLTTDRWDVTVNELRPDGEQSSWQQIFTTTNRDGHVLISSIISGGR